LEDEELNEFTIPEDESIKDDLEKMLTLAFPKRISCFVLSCQWLTSLKMYYLLAPLRESSRRFDLAGGYSYRN
jgi:hypothetical protein